MKAMETTAYYAFGVPVYVGLAALEWLLARRRRHPTLSFAESFGNISAGLGSIAVGLFLGPALIALYDFGYTHLALYHWDKGSPAPWLAALVLADFGHYWHHRLDHRVAACWAIHSVHHQPEEMNFTVGMRHAWFSDLYSFPFYVLAPLCGVPTAHFFIATTVLSFHALVTHTAELDFPGLGIFVTPSSHILHHAKNPGYLDKNFGAMLAIWDRLFGTHVERQLADPPVYGAHGGYQTHDGALSQWVPWRDLLARVRREGSVSRRLRVLLSRPVAVDPTDQGPRARQSTAVSWQTRLYVAAQFAGLLLVSLYVFILRDRHSVGLKAGAAIFFIATLFTLGGILDGRRRAWPSEAARLLLGAPALLWVLAAG